MSDLIHASYCKSCGRVIVPPREICPYCGLTTGPMEPVDLKPEGTVVSFSVLEMPPSGFDPPVLLALVELERGATVLSLGEKRHIGAITIGSHVSLYYDDDNRLCFIPLSEELKTAK
ncbi:MAG: Zn-ribbon domain-containing OB-fold protein [Candidatus Thorarchaeota archaeon]